jgi:hypothetical protein
VCLVQVLNKCLRSWRKLLVRSLPGLMPAPSNRTTPMCSAERRRHWARCPLYRAPVPCLLRPRLPDYAMALSTRRPREAGSGELWEWAEALPSDAERECGASIPLNPARAPCTDPSSNSPCETVMAARGTAPRFKWIACSPNAWAPPTSHHGVYQSYTYQPINCAANHHWSR